MHIPLDKYEVPCPFSQNHQEYPDTKKKKKKNILIQTEGHDYAIPRQLFMEKVSSDILGHEILFLKKASQ